ncbi:hypothetical protein BST61_g3213 [Cercospora zeina]
MSSTTPSRTPTSFFSLARELRDQIYYELLISIPATTTTLSNRIHLHATSTPFSHLLLLNKQFSHEYLSLSLKLSTLTISNHISSTAFTDLAPHRIFSASEILYIEPGTTASTLSYKLALKPLPTLPPPALRIRNLNFDIICSRFRAPTDELSMLETWTNGILSQFSLKELKSVGIDIVVQEDSNGMAVWELESEILWSGNWLFLKGLKGLRIWRDGRVGELGNGIRVRNSRRKRVKVLEWDVEGRRFGRCEGSGVAGLGMQSGNVWLNTAV